MDVHHIDVGRTAATRVVSTSRLRRSRAASWALGTILAGLLALAGCSTAEPPPGPVHDLPCSVLSDGGAFRVTAETDLQPLTLNRLHRWTLRVETPSGRPVENARIAVHGGMPAHQHGLPTVPRVTEELGDGEYLVEGMKFSMPGLWELTFTVWADGKTDQATLQLEL